LPQHESGFVRDDKVQHCDLTSVIPVGQPVFIDPIFKGIGNFPVMIFSVAAIEVIHSHKIVRFKGIENLSVMAKFQ
jgi:hypothetical protein